MTAAFCSSFQASKLTLPWGQTSICLPSPTFVCDSGDLSVLEDPGSTAVPYYSLLVSGTTYHLSFQVPVQDLVTGEHHAANSMQDAHAADCMLTACSAVTPGPCIPAQHMWPVDCCVGTCAAPSPALHRHAAGGQRHPGQLHQHAVRDQQPAGHRPIKQQGFCGQRRCQEHGVYHLLSQHVRQPKPH